MSKFRRTVMWAALILIISLTGLSVYGAFLGASRAKALFNSLPVSVYWFAFAIVITAALASFRRLLRLPALLLIHLGCLLILAGGMWGSQAGHKLQKQLLGIDRIAKGQMAVFERNSENTVMAESGEPIGELPFSVRLKDFRLEYYEPRFLQVKASQGRTWKIPVELNKEFSLGPDYGTVTILKTFENFKITIGANGSTAVDDPQPGYNPALEVQIKNPGGAVTTRYVFERFAGHGHAVDELLMSYHRVISDYISELQITRNNTVVAEKDIEVNHPLHYAGYHFYQHSYDADAHQYTILMVVSDTGLGIVYIGYLMLGIGVFWHLWFRRGRLRRHNQKDN